MEPISATQAPRRPSWLQRLLAHKATYLFIPTLAAIYAEWQSVAHTGVTLRDLLDWRCSAWLVAIILTSGPFGFFLGFIVAAFANQFPLLIANLLNKGPFKVGDHVQIITGKFAGTVTTITDGWQGNCVRVDLGPGARKDFKDIFRQNELMRASN